MESFQQEANSHINIKCGCPKCASSKGEKWIRELLISNKIDFVEHYKPISGRNLSYDFYINSLNLIIEFDRKQHSENIDHFGGEVEFKKQQLRDLTKDQYCDMNNIRLIRINHLYQIKEV